MLNFLRPQKIRDRIRSFRSYGLDRLDRRLDKYLNQDRGFFVELGANNGISQSNTAYLERYRQWSGILIEPIPRLFRECRRNRPKAVHFNCACVDPDTATQEIVGMMDCNLMSVVSGALGEKEATWIASGEQVQNIRAQPVRVPCRTLSSILEECGNPAVDLLSLDVEGYETSVLQGLDLSRHRPRYILVEVVITPLVELTRHLGEHYDYVAHLSQTDVLLRSRSA